MSAAEAATDVPPEVQDFMQQHRTLTLATASPTGLPRASTFLYVCEGATLYFWTRANTLTARQIEQNPTVAFTIDRYTEDLNQTQGIQGLGECAVLLSGEQIARVADLFGRRFPTLEPGSTMSISFFRITPTELQFIDNRSDSARAQDGTFGADFHRERSYSVIAGLPMKPAERVTATLQPMEVAAGEPIVREGTPADKYLILVAGEAEVLRDEQLLDTLSAGQLFGEVAIMREQPRSVTVRAKTDARLLALDRDTFRSLVAQSLELSVDFDQVIRERLASAGAERA
jgi:uncharacterized protein YhbP (UPF0306 family)